MNRTMRVLILAGIMAAAPAFAGAQHSVKPRHHHMLRVDAGDGNTCALSVADLGKALNGKSAKCADVIQVAMATPAARTASARQYGHERKYLYNYNAWYAKPRSATNNLQYHDSHYWGQN